MSRRYSLLWRNKWLTAHATTIDDMIEALEGAAAQLRALRGAGVRLEGGAEDAYAYLVTTDPDIAAKHGFEEEEIEGDEAFEGNGSNGRDHGPFSG